MQIGELIVARVGGRLTIGRCVTPPDKTPNPRVRIAVGRGRENKIPADRVVLATGVVASDQAEANTFGQTCGALASAIDLAEVWEVAEDADSPLGLDDIAELHWGPTPTSPQKVALLLHLDRESLYFAGVGDRFLPKPPKQVEEVKARRQREAENARDADTLVDGLSRGILPEPMSRHQAGLVQHLRGYVVHGDSYTRAALARDLLGKVENGGGGDLQQTGFELLTAVGVLSPDEPLELERAGIAVEFPEDATAEAVAVALDLTAILSQSHREDLTPVSVLTIDDSSTEDRDDALSLEATGDGVYRLGIHITDTVALIPSGSAMDREAGLRMATLYTPEHKIPMLPPEVSSGAGSLAPGEHRAALSVIIDVTASGDVVEWKIVPSTIRSRAALTYDETDAAIRDQSGPWSDMLRALQTIAEGLRQTREESGALTVDSPEMHVKLLESGEVEVKVVARSTPARSTVTELMILCNSLLAKYCLEKGLAAVYRSQPAPDLSDLPDLPNGPLRRFHLFRRLRPAGVSTVPAPHGGLGVEAYIQATSPLRRYPDLIMQRQITYFLSTGEGRYTADEIASVSHRADAQLREMSRIEDDRRRYWFHKYLQQQLDTPEIEDRTFFQAVVLENEERRLALMELSDYPFRFRTRLPWAILPGETVGLRLRGIDLWRRFPQFVHEP